MKLKFPQIWGSGDRTSWFILIIKPTRCIKTPVDGQRNCPKHVEFYSKNKFEILRHLVGFIIRIYHDSRSRERQRLKYLYNAYRSTKYLVKEQMQAIIAFQLQHPTVSYCWKIHVRQQHKGMHCCVSIATIVTRIRHNITLYASCLSGYIKCGLGCRGFHYTTLRKPSVSAELSLAGRVLQVCWQRYECKTPWIFMFIGPCIILIVE